MPVINFLIENIATIAVALLLGVAVGAIVTFRVKAKREGRGGCGCGCEGCALRDKCHPTDKNNDEK